MASRQSPSYTRRPSVEQPHSAIPVAPRRKSLSRVLSQSEPSSNSPLPSTTSTPSRRLSSSGSSRSTESNSNTSAGSSKQVKAEALRQKILADIDTELAYWEKRTRRNSTSSANSEQTSPLSASIASLSRSQVLDQLRSAEAEMALSLESESSEGFSYNKHVENARSKVLEAQAEIRQPPKSMDFQDMQTVSRFLHAQFMWFRILPNMERDLVQIRRALAASPSRKGHDTAYLNETRTLLGKVKPHLHDLRKIAKANGRVLEELGLL